MRRQHARDRSVLVVAAGLSYGPAMSLTTRGRLCLLAVFLLTAAGLAACRGVQLGDGNQCLPSPMTASPSQIVVGGTVTVSSPSFACRASYPAGKQYRLLLAEVGRAAPWSLGRVPVGRDGSFRASLVIPTDAPPGEASIEVSGSAFDDCGDTAGGSCAGYAVALTLLPAPS
jgi:hypothetical protein